MAMALVLSGGSGQRMGFEGFPKQYIRVAGKRVIEYALQGITEASSVNGLVVVAATEWQAEIEAIQASLGAPYIPSFAEPGTTRQESIRNGLLAMRTNPPEDDVVVVHDAARPNLAGEMLDGYIDALPGYDGVLPALPMKDTVYCSQDRLSVTSLLDRDSLFCGQAPEVFRFGAYLHANTVATDEEIEITRGSSELAFRHGLSIRMVPGSEANFKITTRSDLRRFCEQVGADYDACIAEVEVKEAARDRR